MLNNGISADAIRTTDECNLGLQLHHFEYVNEVLMSKVL